MIGKRKGQLRLNKGNDREEMIKRMKYGYTVLQTRKCKDKGRRQGEDEYSGSMTTGINKNVGELN